MCMTSGALRCGRSLPGDVYDFRGPQVRPLPTGGRATTTGARGGDLASRWPFDPMLMIIPSPRTDFLPCTRVPLQTSGTKSRSGPRVSGEFTRLPSAHTSLPTCPAAARSSIRPLSPASSFSPSSHGVGLASSVLPVETSRSVSLPQNKPPAAAAPPRIGWTPPCTPPPATTTPSPTCFPASAPAPAPASRVLFVVCQTSRWVERGVMNLPPLMLVTKMAKMMMGMRMATSRRAKRRSRKERSMTIPRPVMPRRNK